MSEGRSGRYVARQNIATKKAPLVATMRPSGSVEGYAATFDHDVPDSYGDVIRAGAFKRTLQQWSEKGYPIPLLYGHNTNDPAMNIGVVTSAREDEHGLYVRAEFDADNETAQTVRKLTRQGRLFQFSFAYQVRDQARVKLENGTYANELRDVDLLEVSLVQIAANQRAVVTGVKSGHVTYDAELERLKTYAAAILEAIEVLYGV